MDRLDARSGKRAQRTGLDLKALWPRRASRITLVATMRIRIVSHALVVAVIAAAPGLRAQDATKRKPSPFWQSTVPFEMTLTVNFKKVSETCLGRRTIAFGSCQDKLDSAPWVPATVTYVDNGATVMLPARVRARGISRLRICDLVPPLWVDFKGADRLLDLRAAQRRAGRSERHRVSDRE